MGIIFGPAGLGPTKNAIEKLEQYHKQGLKACEIAFVHGVYIKDEKDAALIGKKAQELGIKLSIHAPYYVNLNSKEKEKREATKQRIIDCCRAGVWLGATKVVFHPGYYNDDKEESYLQIRDGVAEIMKYIKGKKWNIKIAPETMGKVNVFGSADEISRLAKDTECSFCIDYAHLLARDKKVDYKKIEELFPQEDWHVHFSGIVYGEKGEKHHKPTEKSEWKELLEKLPRSKKITIINESPQCIEDSIAGLKINNSLTN